MSDLKMIIARNLVELRKSKKYTQQDLAEILQYSDKAISKWEKGDSLPDIEVLYQICNLYGVTLDFLTHEGSIEDKKEYIIPKYEIRNKAIITFLFIIAIWTLGVAAFVAINIYSNKVMWPIFVWCVPLSATLLIYFNLKWGKRLFNVFIFTIMLWGYIAGVFLQILYSANINIWPIFLVGIPIEIAIILWAFLKHD
jgi:transcriptional regulator with XRE-family HTH domain